jgi:pimeloyl-ACP methyl ester carboxylesterase
MNRIIVRLSRALGLATAVLLAASPAARAGHEEGDQGFDGEALPIVFVHGFSGSAAQYETQALRWASNGYPKPVTGIDRLFVGFSLSHLDAFIDAVLAETGDSQVYAVGHSAGTAVMTAYLNSSPARAARVAKYIGIDGASNTTCPGGVDLNGDPNVPCMGIWARGSLTRMVGPDHNIYLSEQGHTQSVGSPESFRAQHRFFTGHEPATTLILPEPPGQVEIAGRALNFPNNTGIEGAIVELWEVHPGTGARKYSSPDVEVVLDSTGNFGPWAVNGQQRYEINVIRQAEDGARQQHFYYEPWTRSNSLLRLNISPIGSTLSEAIRAHSGPHDGASVVRQKEWWGSNDVDPTNVDVLRVITSTPDGIEDAGNVATAGTAPYAASTIAMIMFDVDADGQTHTDSLVNLGPFLSGVDVYMPAPTDPPNGTVTFAHQQRRTDHPQAINTPNWSVAADHFMTVTFRDWTQDIDSWGECKSAGPSPCD